MKARLITSLSFIPFIAAMAMSESCAVSCPYGLVNDPFPGQCPRYTDLSGDGLCDFSQVSTTVTTDNSTTSTDTSTDNTQVTNTSDQVNGHGAVSDQQVDSNASTIPDSSNGIDNGSFYDGSGYHVLPISILLIAGYLFTHYLFTKGVLDRKKHRRIWNILLTTGYFGMGSTGVILIFLVNLGIRTALNPTITFWHVEFAVLMTITTLIHIHLNWKPFKNIFKVLFKNTSFN
ncbi:hypothetical protein [Methanobacterium spitsbergense]|uniref:DUF4405 domain-containing protein n=1 Tax=Methanobacterium spitsbergense TaxID=2874285 RepID=A0A8T5US09_9EURY|nr:hypothetical protein [Methanobacterium spitsbergense]MBZ2166474.1 hypothetical protein [Methanobacterium spitsbergense]